MRIYCIAKYRIAERLVAFVLYRVIENGGNNINYGVKFWIAS